MTEFNWLFFPLVSVLSNAGAYESGVMGGLQPEEPESITLDATQDDQTECPGWFTVSILSDLFM